MGYYIDSSGQLRQKSDAPDFTTDNRAVPFLQIEEQSPAGDKKSDKQSDVQTIGYPYGDRGEDLPSDVRGFARPLSEVAFTYIDPDSGAVVKITWGDMLDAGVPMPTSDKEATNAIARAKLLIFGTSSTRDPSESPLEDDGGGGGGGGRGRSGGSAAAPVYLAPNREEVAEQLKSYVVATTGKNNADVLNDAVDAYMEADKAAWDLQVSGKGGEQPSPFMAAKNVVRATDEYKTIHYLRPDSVDEMDWVTGTQGKLRQLGISAARSEELGIRQASVGATDRDLVGASEVSLQSNNKLMADSQRTKLKQSVSAVARMIK